jgi:hypothetical protein
VCGERPVWRYAAAGADALRIFGRVVAAVVLMHVVVVSADEWATPRVQTVFSANGQYFVRVIPATVVSTGSGTPRGEFYRRQPDRSYHLVADVALQNRVSPTYAIVNDDGYFVTFDEWSQMGIGQVIAFYGPSGTLIRAVRIEDLYTPDKLADLPQSVSSRWWRCGVYYTAPSGANEEAFTVVEHFGGSFSLHPRTGTFDYRPGTAKCAPGFANATMF